MRIIIVLTNTLILVCARRGGAARDATPHSNILCSNTRCSSPTHLSLLLSSSLVLLLTYRYIYIYIYMYTHIYNKQNYYVSL